MDPHTLWVLFPSLFMYWEALVYKASDFFTYHTAEWSIYFNQTPIREQGEL